MAGTSVSHRWSVAPGVMRVECNLGHSEAIGDAQTATPCGVMLGPTRTVACGRARVIVGRGGMSYDPANNAQRSAVQAIATWG